MDRPLIRPPENFTPSQIFFLGEQSGQVEDELKALFSQELNRNTSVLSAYLARLSYGKTPGYSVALCIRSTIGIDAALEQRLGQIFSRIFRTDQHFDTLFVREDQELELKMVCRPFYQKQVGRISKG